MAWVIKDWSAQFKSQNVVEVKWLREDNANLGTRRRGIFDHTLVGNKTWDQNKADVQTKINNEEGLITG
jgi:hypothetical protein